VADPGRTGPSNKELKLTKREHNGASQLTSSVRPTKPQFEETDQLRYKKMITRRRVLVAAWMLLQLAGITAAQPAGAGPEPLIGSWRLNVSASQIPAGEPQSLFPRQRTETYRRLESGRLQLTIQDGPSAPRTLSWPEHGGVINDGGPPSDDMTIETFIVPGEWRVTYLSKGSQYLTMRKVVSADGKRMRQEFRGEDAQHKSFEALLVFDRQ